MTWLAMVIFISKNQQLGFNHRLLTTVPPIGLHYNVLENLLLSSFIEGYCIKDREVLYHPKV